MFWLTTAVDGASLRGLQNDEPREPDLAALIAQLGDDDFQVRRLAEKRILEIGAPAIAHLKNARSIGDSEIRFRARRLLVHVLRADYQQRIQRFIASTDPEDSFGLNGWREFSSIAGHDESARQLFVLMQQTEKDVFLSWNSRGPVFDQAADAVIAKLGTRSGPTIVATLASGILIKTMQNESFRNLRRSGVEVTSAEIDNFVGSQSSIANRLDENRVVRVIETGPYKAAFTRLFNSWLDSLPVAISSTPLKLRVIIRLELDNYLDFAAESSTDPEIAVDLRAEAISLVARSRKLKYLTTLEQLLSDNTLVGEFQTGFQEDQKIRVEIRDIALAALVHISDQAYTEFGFEHYRGLDDQFIILSQAGFTTPEQRQVAMTKWRVFKEKLSNERH